MWHSISPQTTSLPLAMTTPEPELYKHVRYTTVYQLQIGGEPQWMSKEPTAQTDMLCLSEILSLSVSETSSLHILFRQSHQLHCY